MWHILLLILKIIGITIVSILAVLIIAAVLALFVPVRYQLTAKGSSKGRLGEGESSRELIKESLNGSLNDSLGKSFAEAFVVKLRVHWLFHLFSVRFLYPEAPYFKATFLGFTVYDPTREKKPPRKDKMGRKDKRKNKRKGKERNAGMDHDGSEQLEPLDRVMLEVGEGAKRDDLVEADVERKRDDLVEADVARKRDDLVEADVERKRDDLVEADLERKQNGLAESARKVDSFVEGETGLRQDGLTDAGTEKDLAVVGDRFGEDGEPDVELNFGPDVDGENGEDAEIEEERVPEAESQGIFGRLFEWVKGIVLGLVRRLKEIVQKVRKAIEKIQYTIKKICDTIRHMIGNLRYYVELAQSETVAEALRLIKEQLLLLWRELKPQKCIIRLKAGTGDPSSTGQIMAIYGMLYPFCGNYITLETDFENQILEGDALIRGRVRIIVVVIIVIRLYRDRNLRKLLKLIHKEEI